ncbi:hypothetical protein O6H91_22G027100 [Diphasiastrum complanatum]|uniref:Uncharacterized protein n=1 Tax=Diphasiastrum complanatum TaxID=34168 RepID=A0ACC2AE82_DIPCM|nr:hypothetical protein O6H91_22G027100 [Diphasiastrum complanatum]
MGLGLGSAHIIDDTNELPRNPGIVQPLTLACSSLRKDSLRTTTKRRTTKGTRTKRVGCLRIHSIHEQQFEAISNRPARKLKTLGVSLLNSKINGGKQSSFSEVEVVLLGTN